jgi:hypothetical protein
MELSPAVKHQANRAQFVWAATVLPSFLNCGQEQADKDRDNAGVHNQEICHMNKYLRIN